ncbi:esterase FE4-like [Leptidea sinapis]|uniref:Carboxylic ester hydrolase n=1 Tax=Leptidea sinapis TaxID=189913 RepID=A0A5E4R6I5_9NEOP|nr:esterase FE4-like [Leptidea sinapis]VVD06176.1 unnamed protein product [Leptidea sinapis]
MMGPVKLIYLFCFISCVCCQFRVDPLVLIDQGLVRGRRSADASYSSFLGVPYARVDLENPFGPALPHPGFDDEIFNAFDGSLQCPQSITSASRATSSADETLDCLRLNVYVPTVASSQNPLPVLVWIHGGIYSVGSAGNYGPENLVKQGILVVTMNYRLGPYGFMCLDVPEVPGNQGLKDQYDALRWVRRNIRAFGGNPYNVTIGGQSAGAGSVLLHLYSNRDKLYNKVIAQSGTPQKPVSFVDADVESAIKIASFLGFNTSNTAEALNFLKSTPHELVSAAAADLNLKLRPCKERSFSGIENFINSDPFSMSNEKKVKNTPILIGQTSKEHYGSQANNDDAYYESDPFYDTLNESFNLNENELLEAAEIVKHFYIGDKPISKEVVDELETFTTDILYNHPIERTVSNLLKENANPMFEYQFKYVGNKDIAGAPHNEELKYLFQFYDEIVEKNEQNELIVKRMTKLWCNFVKYGNPTPEVDELLPVKWPKVTKELRPYMTIDTELNIEHRINKERMAFWDLFYKTYGKYNTFNRNCNKHL